MNYYRKPINKVANDVKSKMQLGALTLKLSENNKKIDSLIDVDRNVKKDISSNLSKIDNNENDISSNLEKINSIKNDISTQIKSDVDEIKSNLSNIDFNSNNKYTIENFFIYNIEIENDYTLNKDNPEFSIFNYNLEDDFKSRFVKIKNIKKQNLLYRCFKKQSTQKISNQKMKSKERDKSVLEYVQFMYNNVHAYKVPGF